MVLGLFELNKISKYVVFQYSYIHGLHDLCCILEFPYYTISDGKCTTALQIQIN